MLLKRSPKQIEASRLNGAQSRGPVTPAGKAASSRNSLRHGLRSRHADPLIRRLIPDPYTQVLWNGWLSQQYPDRSQETAKIIDRLSFDIPFLRNIRRQLADMSANPARTAPGCGPEALNAIDSSLSRCCARAFDSLNAIRRRAARAQAAALSA